MVDRHRVLTRLAELEQYLTELDQIRPATRGEFKAVEKRRACERLLQISIETVISVCQLFVTGLRAGLPSEENDLFEKLVKAEVLSPAMASLLQSMKGFRNIPVHEYGEVDDDLVYLFLTTRDGDFADFRREIQRALDRTA